MNLRMACGLQRKEIKTMNENEQPTKFETDLIKGSVAKKLLLFAIPFIISNLVQSLYAVADMIIVGQFNGAASMSGVNIGSNVSFLMTNMIFGLCVGATVLIGQYLGNGDRKKLNDTIATLFTLLIFAAVILSALMLIFRKPLLDLIQTPPESYDEAMIYLVVTTIGTIFIFGYNAFAAVMRGMGDSKTPLIFVSIACVLSFIGDLILVGIFKTGAAGASISTVISQALSMILCIIYFKRHNFVFDFKLKSFRVHKESLKMILKIGIPTSVQNVITSISFIIMIAMVNSLGVTASAAVGAVGKFNSFAILPAIAISSSIAAMSAQNIGAGEYGRAKKTMKTGLVIAVCMSMVMFVIAQLFPGAILRIFGDDEGVIREGIVYLRTFSFDYIFAPIMFAFNGLFIGSGHTMFSLLNNMSSAILIRVPVAYIFGMVFGWKLLGIGLGGPFASGMALVICIIYYFTGKWRKAVIIKREEEVII